MNDKPCYVEISEPIEMSHNFTIRTENGNEVRIDLSGGTVKVIGGREHLDEAAKIFFECLLKDVVDQYVKSELEKRG